jgi:hypothetical protein
VAQVARVVTNVAWRWSDLCGNGDHLPMIAPSRPLLGAYRHDDKPAEKFSKLLPNEYAMNFGVWGCFSRNVERPRGRLLNAQIWGRGTTCPIQDSGPHVVATSS